MENKFKENLKNLRIFREMSQKDLASLLDVSFKTLSHWESGYSEPNIDMIIKIKEALNVSFDELFE